MNQVAKQALAHPKVIIKAIHVFHEIIPLNISQYYTYICLISRIMQATLATLHSKYPESIKVYSLNLQDFDGCRILTQMASSFNVGLDIPILREAHRRCH